MTSLPLINNKEKAFPNGYDDGLTVRDYLAAKAMAALIVKAGNFDLELLSERSYNAADAMMKQRVK